MLLMVVPVGLPFGWRGINITAMIERSRSLIVRIDLNRRKLRRTTISRTVDSSRFRTRLGAPTVTTTPISTSTARRARRSRKRGGLRKTPCGRPTRRLF